MPIYEYRCQKCSHHYEKREGFDAPSQQRCPKCRGKALRVLQPAPIVFKGSGFYVTDSRKPAPPESNSAASKDGGTEAKAKDSPDKSTDSASAEPAPAG